MIGFRLSIDEVDFKRRVQREVSALVADLRKSNTPIPMAVRAWRLAFVRELIRQLSGKTMNIRSRELLRSSVVDEMKVEGDSLIVRVHTDIPYAAIYEQKSRARRTVRATGGTFLTVPIPHTYTKRPKPLRDYPEKTTFLKPLNKGVGYLVLEKAVPRSMSKPIYALKKSVLLPYRPWLTNALEETIPSFEKAVYKAIAKRKG